MIECDYAEALRVKFDTEIRSEAFGFNHTLSIEGSTYQYHNKYQNARRNQSNVKMDFHSHFSYDSDPNAATMCENTRKLIHWMYANNFFINNGIIYDNTYGCRKIKMCKRIV